MPIDLRIGDRERAAAAERLSAHHAAGRLSVEELERRLERAGAAVFAHDLGALEADLPSVDPRGRAIAPRGNPFWADGSRRLPRAPLALPVALIALGLALSFAAGHPIAPLFVVAALLLWRRFAWT